MCGIGGITIYSGSRGKQHTRLAFIKAVADSLLIENVRRGGQASGIAVFNKEEWGIYKDPLSGTRLVQEKGYSEFTERFINSETLNILVHTRAATQGSPHINDNNHPIATSRVVGVHNGWVNNDDQLFAEHQLPRIAEVDSEVIFALTDKKGYGDVAKGQDPNRMYAENMRDVAEELFGSATYALVGKESRNEMWLVKKDNPATFCYVPWFNVTFFASQENFVTATLQYAFKVLVEYGMLREVFAKQLMRQAVMNTPKDGSIWRFDALEADGMAQFTGNRPCDIECSEGDWGFGYYYGGGRGRNLRTSTRGSTCDIADEEKRQREVMQKWVSGEVLTDEEKSILRNSSLLV